MDVGEQRDLIPDPRPDRNPRLNRGLRRIHYRLGAASGMVPVDEVEIFHTPPPLTEEANSDDAAAAPAAELPELSQEEIQTFYQRSLVKTPRHRSETPSNRGLYFDESSSDGEDISEGRRSWVRRLEKRGVSSRQATSADIRTETPTLPKAAASASLDSAREHNAAHRSRASMSPKLAIVPDDKMLTCDTKDNSSSSDSLAPISPKTAKSPNSEAGNAQDLHRSATSLRSCDSPRAPNSSTSDLTAVVSESEPHFTEDQLQAIAAAAARERGSFSWSEDLGSGSSDEAQVKSKSSDQKTLLTVTAVTFSENGSVPSNSHSGVAPSDQEMATSEREIATPNREMATRSRENATASEDSAAGRPGIRKRIRMMLSRLSRPFRACFRVMTQD